MHSYYSLSSFYSLSLYHHSLSWCLFPLLSCFPTHVYSLSGLPYNSPLTCTHSHLSITSDSRPWSQSSFFLFIHCHTLLHLSCLCRRFFGNLENDPWRLWENWKIFTSLPGAATLGSHSPHEDSLSNVSSAAPLLLERAGTPHHTRMKAPTTYLFLKLKIGVAVVSCRVVSYRLARLKVTYTYKAVSLITRTISSNSSNDCNDG